MAVAGLGGLAAFLAREHTAASPMMPLAIFRVRQFAATNAVTFIVYAALTGAIGPRLQMTAGPLVTAAGFVLLTLAAHGLSLLRMAAALRARLSCGS